MRANALVILLTRVHAARRCPDKPAKAQASSVMARANKVSQELLHMRSLSRQSTTDLCAMQAGWITLFLFWDGREFLETGHSDQILTRL